jgi:hypothetical protein
MEKNLRIVSDHDERFNFVIQKFFAKNKYCNTVKIFKRKTQKRHFVSKLIDYFITDLVIND